jgi:hypothetical protein
MAQVKPDFFWPWRPMIDFNPDAARNFCKLPKYFAAAQQRSG